MVEPLPNTKERRPSLMSYQDRTLTCQDCGQEFTFSADDQQYHAEKGYTNEPKRCPLCRSSRRAGGGGGGGGGYSGGRREMHQARAAGAQVGPPFAFLRADGALPSSHVCYNPLSRSPQAKQRRATPWLA